MSKILSIIIVVLFLNACASSNLKINKHINDYQWKKVAIMPVDGKYGDIANRKLTYQLSSIMLYESILPEFLIGDIELEIRKRGIDKGNLALYKILANKYKADAFLHTKISIHEQGIGSKATVFMKIIDTASNQVFAMSQNEGSSYFNEESLVEELIDETLEEMAIAFQK
jgi:hypothetical protein